MSLASKLSAGLLAAACVCSLAAAEVISINEPADFTTPKRLVKGEDSLTVKGQSFTLISSKILTLDQAKKYKISADFRLKEGEQTGVFYLGLVPFDAAGKQVRAVEVNAMKDTDTFVAKAAKAGDTVIYVKDASKWKANTPHGYIAFDTKADCSDLPNRNVAAFSENGIKQDGDVWEITLKAPLAKDVAEGTNVRQQMAGASYIYTYSSKKVAPQEWISASGVIAGSTSKSGSSSKQLWAGTASVRVLVMMLGGKNGNVIEFKNLKVEEAE